MSFARLLMFHGLIFISYVRKSLSFGDDYQNLYYEAGKCPMYHGLTLEKLPIIVTIIRLRSRL